MQLIISHLTFSFCNDTYHHLHVVLVPRKAVVVMGDRGVVLWEQFRLPGGVDRDDVIRTQSALAAAEDRSSPRHTGICRLQPADSAACSQSSPLSCQLTGLRSPTGHRAPPPPPLAFDGRQGCKSRGFVGINGHVAGNPIPFGRAQTDRRRQTVTWRRLFLDPVPGLGS